MLNKKPAKSGCDYIRNANMRPMLKTRKGWQQYANRLANNYSKRDGFLWTGVLWECDEYIRVNLASQQFNPTSR